MGCASQLETPALGASLVNEGSRRRAHKLRDPHLTHRYSQALGFA